MCLVVGGFDICRRDVRVNLGSYKAFMSEQFLDASDIGTAVEQVGGEAMPQGMGARTSIESTFLDVFFEHSSDASGG